MSMHITMNDANPEGNKKLTIFPSPRESRLEITQVIGNPPTKEILVVFWFKNEDLKKAIKALDDPS